MEDGRWKMADGSWEMEVGRWEMAFYASNLRQVLECVRCRGAFAAGPVVAIAAHSSLRRADCPNPQHVDVSPAAWMVPSAQFAVAPAAAWDQPRSFPVPAPRISARFWSASAAAALWMPRQSSPSPYNTLG